MSQQETLAAKSSNLPTTVVRQPEENWKTRVDPPHALGGSSSTEEASQGLLIASSDNEITAEQLHLQALQLAELLRQRQQELDAREANLNSCIARWEAEQRAARLNEIEQEARLNAQYDALKQKQCELEKLAAQLSTQQHELEQLKQALQEREQNLLAQERRLAKGEARFQKRLDRLAAAEAAQLRSVRQTEECLAGATELNALRERLVAEHQHALAELEAQRQAVERRAEQVAKREAALKQVREEMALLHRETLEIRLATEELWARLAGAAPPPKLTQSLAHIRGKLAEQYRLANAELAEEKEKLEAIHRQIVAEHEKLVRRKKDFDLWFAGREQECQQQAERLLACEQKLRRQMIRFRRQSHLWQLEKVGKRLRNHQPRKAAPASTQPVCRAENSPSGN